MANGPQTDSELLHRFAIQRDEAAFAEIVARYAGLVYSAGMRQVGPSLAEDVSQAVFIVLAQKAARVDGRSLAGWLVNAARLAALASQRMETRCKQRERKAAQMKGESIGDDSSSDDGSQWEELAPLLDEALARLDEKDRTAVTLRYLQGKSVRDVATAMSVSEAAAGKRATRAIQALRDYFARRGVRLSADSLGKALAVHAVMAVPTSLAGKLSATATGVTALTTAATTTSTAMSVTATNLAKGMLPLMMTKTYTAAAVVAVAAIAIGGGAVLIAAKLAGSPSTASAPPSPPTDVQVFEAAVGVAPTPATQPTTQRAAEIYTRYPTPAGTSAKFAGRVEGLRDPSVAEVGIVHLRGTQWTSFGNYEWRPVNDDGTFEVTAEKFPEARRAIAVRAKGQSVTYLRAEFEANESGRDIVVKMKPTRQIQIAARDAHGVAFGSFKVEIFDSNLATREMLQDDAGRPIRPQRLDAPMSSGGIVTVDVPLEPLCVLVSGKGIAPYMDLIDPRKSEHFEFSLLHSTPLTGTLLDGGKPVAGEQVTLNNPAVGLSYTVKTTDADGRFQVADAIPGEYNIRLRSRGRTVKVALTEGEPLDVTIDLATLDSETPTLLPTTAPTTSPASTAR